MVEAHKIRKEIIEIKMDMQVAELLKDGLIAQKCDLMIQGKPGFELAE